MVRSPLTAARATFALKAGEWFRRGRLLMVSPVHGDYRRCQAEIPLIVLFRFPGPALTPLTHAFARLLQSGYANELKVRAEWLSRRFGSLNDSQLTAFMSANVGRWGAEFERLTSLRTLEL